MSEITYVYSEDADGITWVMRNSVTDVFDNIGGPAITGTWYVGEERHRLAIMLGDLSDDEQVARAKSRIRRACQESRLAVKPKPPIGSEALWQ